MVSPCSIVATSFRTILNRLLLSSQQKKSDKTHLWLLYNVGFRMKYIEPVVYGFPAPSSAPEGKGGKSIERGWFHTPIQPFERQILRSKRLFDRLLASSSGSPLLGELPKGFMCDNNDLSLGQSNHLLEVYFRDFKKISQLKKQFAINNNLRININHFLFAILFNIFQRRCFSSQGIGSPSLYAAVPARGEYLLI